MELEENLEKEEEDEFDQKVQEEIGGFEPASSDWQATALALRLHELVDHNGQIKETNSGDWRGKVWSK